MATNSNSITFSLQPTEIDRASEWFVDMQTKAGVEKLDRLRARLVLEEILLNMANHHGEEQEVDAFFENRLGRFRLRLQTRADKFNPLKSSEYDQDEWSAKFFSSIGLHTQYSYSMGVNILRIPLTKKPRNPILRTIIAILIGVALGLLGNIAIPDIIQTKITNVVLHPIGDMWVRLLQAVSGPVVFFMALTAVIETRHISDYGGSRAITLTRYFLTSVLAVVLAVLFCRFFFPLDVASTEASGQLASNILDRILQIVPSNLTDPLADANTPQLMLIAIATGYILATPGFKADTLKTLIQDVNTLGLGVARLTGTFVPFFVGLLLCLRIWTKDYVLLLNVWQPFAAGLLVSIVFFLITLLVVAMRTSVNPLLLARKLAEPFITALRNGVLDYSSVDDLATSCKNLLGTDETFAKTVLPQGLVLFMPTSAVGIYVFSIYVAKNLNVPVDQLWLLSAAALAVILAVATPPVSGANLLAFVVLFAYLRISSEAILDAMIFDVVFGVFCIAADQALLELETILQARHLGFLDTDVLRAPIPE